jgi:hypothetical protein
VFPPTPVMLGFTPLTIRVCQHKYKDIYMHVRQTRVCESLRSYKMSEHSVSPVQARVQARAHKVRVEQKKVHGIVREVDVDKHPRTTHEHGNHVHVCVYSYSMWLGGVRIRIFMQLP